jgi:hypothetical protein
MRLGGRQVIYDPENRSQRHELIAPERIKLER